MNRIEVADLIFAEVWSRTNYNMLGEDFRRDRDVDLYNRIFFPKVPVTLEMCQKVWDIKDEQK